MLRVDNVTCERGQRQIFSNITFKLLPGQLILLLGANGSGKTSLLKVLAGLLAVSHGKISCERQLLYIGHRLGLNPNLTARENLQFLLDLNDVNDSINMDLALQHCGIEHLSTLPTGQLSAGQCQKIALAILLLQSADLWLLDEPFTALDSKGVLWMQELLGKHLTNGGSAVIAMHHPQDFLRQLSVAQITL